MSNVHVVGRGNRMSNKPSVVLVHGFWGGAAHWAKVIVELNGRGYGSLHAVENPLTSLSDDAERTRKMVKQVDGPVLLVGHSYGGGGFAPGRRPTDRRWGRVAGGVPPPRRGGVYSLCGGDPVPAPPDVRVGIGG